MKAALPSLKLGDEVVTEVYKKLREKIIEENLECDNHLRQNLTTILQFYFDNLDNIDKSKLLAYINVSIVCNIYQAMRDHLLKEEKKICNIMKQILPDAFKWQTDYNALLSLFNTSKEAWKTD